jgi:hypothetical protein
MFQTPVIEEIKKKNFMFHNFLFRNRAVYEIMYKSIVQPVRWLVSTWSTRIAAWIPKATNTHSDYVIFTAFPAQQ